MSRLIRHYAMKVALCLSGHLRSYERAFASLKQSILDPYQPDVFIHTWDTLGFDRCSDRGDGHLTATAVNSARLQQLYQPKKMRIEPLRRFDTTPYLHRVGSGTRDPSIIFGMFYSVRSANELKSNYERENGSTYDVVIRSRPDLLFHNRLDLASCDVSSGAVFVPQFGSYGGIADQFAFGSSTSIDRYATVYDNIDLLFRQGLSIHGETMMRANIEHYGLPISRTDIEYSLLRANGYVFHLARD